jgi:hypothetical protein
MLNNSLSTAGSQESDLNLRFYIARIGEAIERGEYQRCGSYEGMLDEVQLQMSRELGIPIREVRERCKDLELENLGIDKNRLPDLLK